MRAVHIFVCVVLLVATMSAAPQEGITIHITGPVRVIVGAVDASEEGCGSQFDVAGQEHKNVSTAEQCSIGDGFCVVTGDRCNGTIKTLYNTYHDHCVCCCMQEKQVDRSNDFELFNGRVIRRTQTGDEVGDWDAAMSFCDRFGAKPFIPRTLADYQLYTAVRGALGSYRFMRLPANDRVQEATLRWYTGEVASDITRWDWYDDEVLNDNRVGHDCLIYGYISSSGGGVYMQSCSDNWYPPICEKISC